MNEVQFKVTRSLKRIDNEKFCWHNNVEVDEHERTIHCADCDKAIDAFEYMVRWANEERRYEMEVTYLKRELAALHQEKAELKKEISYTKRKIKDKKIKEIK